MVERIEDRCVTFIIDDQHIYCSSIKKLQHASDYFRAMFDLNMQEKFSDEIELKDTSPDLLKLLIDHVTSDTDLEVTEDNVFSLVEISCMYQFNTVRATCEAYLWRKITTANSLSIMHQVDLFALTDLHDKVKKFILFHLKDVVKCHDFQTLTKECVTKFLKSKYIRLTEPEVFSAVQLWVVHDIERRTEYIEELLVLVRLTNAELVSLIMASDLPDKTRLVKNYTSSAERQDLTYRPGPYCLTYIDRSSGDILYYDEEEQKWEQLTCVGDVVRARTEAGLAKPSDGDGKGEWEGHVCVVGTNMYFMGWCVQAGGNRRFMTTWYQDVWKFDVLDKRWSKATDMPTQRRLHGSCVAPNGQIYVFGGYGSHRVKLDTVESYNTKNGEWKLHSNMLKHQTSSVTAVWLDNCLCLNSEANNYEEYQCYDPCTDQWTEYHTKVPHEVVQSKERSEVIQSSLRTMESQLQTCNEAWIVSCFDGNVEDVNFHLLGNGGYAYCVLGDREYRLIPTFSQCLIRLTGSCRSDIRVQVIPGLVPNNEETCLPIYDVWLGDRLVLFLWFNTNSKEIWCTKYDIGNDKIDTVHSAPLSAPNDLPPARYFNKQNFNSLPLKFW